MVMARVHVWVLGLSGGGVGFKEEQRQRPMRGSFPLQGQDDGEKLATATARPRAKATATTKAKARATARARARARAKAKAKARAKEEADSLRE